MPPAALLPPFLGFVPSPVQRCLREATHLGLPAAPPVLPRAALPALLYIRLLPTCFASRSVAGNVPARRGALRVRAASAFALAAPLARSHGPRATCRTPRSPQCISTGTALYRAAAGARRVAERCFQRAGARPSTSRSRLPAEAPVLPRAALPAQLYRVAVDVRRIAERFFQLAGARSSTARSHCDGDAMKRY